MKIKADIRRYRAIGVVISVVAALWLLTACSSDDAQQEDMEELRFEVHAVTRGVSTSYGDIRAFLTYPDGDDIYTGLLKYDPETHKWRAQNLKVKPGTRIFYLYGYMPATDLPEGSLSNFMDKTNDKLTIPNIPPMTTKDICFVTGVVRSTEEVETIDRGYYTFKYENSDYADKTVLNLLLEHLYGRLAFKFKIGQKYSTLRKIKVTKVSMKAVAQMLNAEITLPQSSTDKVSVKFTHTSESPVEIIEELWTPTDENNGELTTTATKTFGGIDVAVGSGVSETYELICEYDVYDLGDHLLSHRTAHNYLSKVVPEMSQERTVTLTIEPTYLYQLSDDDLDNPEVKIMSN